MIVAIETVIGRGETPETKKLLLRTQRSFLVSFV